MSVGDEKCWFTSGGRGGVQSSGDGCPRRRQWWPHLTEEFEERASVMKSVPRFLKGPYRIAMRVALEAIGVGGCREDPTRNEGGSCSCFCRGCCCTAPRGVHVGVVEGPTEKRPSVPLRPVPQLVHHKLQSMFKLDATQFAISGL